LGFISIIALNSGNVSLVTNKKASILLYIMVLYVSIVPLTGLFPEPFLKDLDLIWRLDISSSPFHGDSI
jgi:hypothetical protein